MEKSEGCLVDNPESQSYTWAEIEQFSHASKDVKWIVINGWIYDVTSWSKQHPGGEKILSSYVGQDASEAWYAFHPDKRHVSKFMRVFRVGRVKDDQAKSKIESPMTSDFRSLRQTVENMGMFKADPLFYSSILAHIIVLELLGWSVLWWFGTGWMPYLISAFLVIVAQIQAGWAQHDYGHLSVFNSTKMNQLGQIFTLSTIKGGSIPWWNYRHSNHHAKTNILDKDPDIDFDPLMVVGKSLPVIRGKQRSLALPYNFQHIYFFLMLPPFAMPVFFNIEILIYVIKHRLWRELFWVSTFYIRWHFMYGSLLGVWGSIIFYLLTRVIESHWFVWVTQMNHLPMEIDYERGADWVKIQLKGTCNVEESIFNNWFTGHLNYQIEHHLFPTMPRCNFHKVAPLVKLFCEKHHLDYQVKPLLRAFADIVRCLKSSGQLWYEAYYG